MKPITLLSTLVTVVLLSGCGPQGSEFYVSGTGNDSNTGSAQEPFKTISAAAAIAQPGDAVIVHGGIYRERINPPRGGNSAVGHAS